MLSKIYSSKGKKNQVDICEITNKQETMIWKKKKSSKLEAIILEHFKVIHNKILKVT
jgi:hypothetical protein